MPGIFCGAMEGIVCSPLSVRFADNIVTDTWTRPKMKESEVKDHFYTRSDYRLWVIHGFILRRLLSWRSERFLPGNHFCCSLTWAYTLHLPFLFLNRFRKDSRKPIDDVESDDEQYSYYLDRVCTMICGGIWWNIFWTYLDQQKATVLIFESWWMLDKFSVNYVASARMRIYGNFALGWHLVFLCNKKWQYWRSVNYFNSGNAVKDKIKSEIVLIYCVNQSCHGVMSLFASRKWFSSVVLGDCTYDRINHFRLVYMSDKIDLLKDQLQWFTVKQTIFHWYVFDRRHTGLPWNKVRRWTTHTHMYLLITHPPSLWYLYKTTSVHD